MLKDACHFAGVSLIGVARSMPAVIAVEDFLSGNVQRMLFWIAARAPPVGTPLGYVHLMTPFRDIFGR